MDEAYADFEWVVAKEPDNARALYGLAESAWRSDRVRLAIDAFGKLIGMGASSVEIHLGRAEALALAGRREEAVDECTKALELDPENPDIHASRGVFNMEIGRYDDALRDLSEAIARDGDLVEAIIARGDLRSRHGDLNGATADFAVAVRLSPDEPELVGRWIRSIGDAGDPVTALKLLAREVERHPDNCGLLLLKGDLLLDAMRPDAARDCYRGIINQAPNEIEPHLRLAEFHERRSEWEHALAEYDSAVRIEPSDPFPRLMRAELLSRIGKKREAESERALASDLRRMRCR
jgi:tetratricopeptide (TPR) repeat protein